MTERSVSTSTIHPDGGSAPAGPAPAVPHAHRRSGAEVLAALGSSADGLSQPEAAARIERFGLNALPVSRRSMWRMLIEQFHDVLIYILLGALAISAVMPFLEGGTSGPEAFLDAGAILAILLLNAGLGLAQEYRAEQAIEMLQRLSAPSARVRRDGGESIVPSRDLVPGDVVIIEAGDRISADGRLIEANQLQLNESSLTGESAPVSKHLAPVDGEPPLAERNNMVFSGTLVTEGTGAYVVTATATATEIGRIARMVSETVVPETPLQGRLTRIGQTMGWVVLGLCGVVVVLGMVQGTPFLEILLTSVTLAVSAVPEGLPAVVTVVFAIGVQRMVNHHAIVRRLDALETLGSVTVICADKTGTITENRMTVTRVWLPGLEQPVDADVATEATSETHGVPVDAGAVDRLARIAAGCNRAELPDVGDPTELALLAFSKAIGVQREAIEQEEVPFSSERKYMRTRHDGRSYVKGAPEQVVELCDDVEAAAVLRQTEAMAADGLRVLAFASTEGDRLVFAGLLGMEDPPRETAASSVAEAERAGIRTIMITGDNGVTAEAVARQVGLTGAVVTGAELNRMDDATLRGTVETAAVFARVSPEHKLRILNALRANGEVVAMSGDGVNDAPALKGAHVGIAMGQVGTQVAREAASIVLADDHYATIVAAIREGRRIYDNIRKFVIFLLRANFDEILLIMSAIALGLPAPYLPLHILWINLMTDGLPALALGMEPAEPDVMRRPPRPPKQSLLHGEWGHLAFAAVWSFGITIFLYWSLLRAGLPLVEARSVTLTMAIAFELLMAQSVRSRRPIWQVGWFTNRWMIVAVAIPALLQLALLYTPLSSVFHLTALDALDWLLVAVFSVTGFLAFELSKLLRHGLHRRPARRPEPV